MMKKLLKVLFVSLGFLLSTISGLMAQEGVTDTEIHIGQWGPQSGPAAPWGSVARGSGDYFKWINENGGIHGRKIIYHMFDDGYNPAKTKAGVKELQEGTGIFAWVGGVGTSPGLAVRDYLMDKKVPWIGPSTGSLAWVSPPYKYLFGVYPLYFSEAKTLVKYAVETMDKKRVAVIYLNDEYGKNGLRGAMEELLSHNMELVAEVPVEKSDTDMKPHVMELRKSKADMVLLWVTPDAAVRIVGTAKAMQFTPQFMSTSTLSDFPLMSHISKGLWEGVICATFGELTDGDDPGIVKYKREVFEKYASREERFSLFYTAGIMFAEPLIEGLKNTGRDLTTEKFIAEMERIKDFKGIGPVVSYKPFNVDDMYSRQGTRHTFLVECLADGKTKKLTGWIRMD